MRATSDDGTPVEGLAAMMASLVRSEAIDIIPSTTLMESTEQRLQAIFRGVLDLPPGSDPRAAAQDQTPTWDSMAHVSLVAAIEAEFGVTIDAGDSLSLTSYDDTRQYLAGLGI